MSAKQMNEAEMIALAKADLQQFSGLYELYITRVYRFFISRTGHMNQAEDLTSQTFLRALENFDRYEYDEKPFGVWLFKIARNLLIDSYRQKKSPVVDLEEAFNLASDEDVEAQAHIRLLYEKVQDTLQEFPEVEREIILLKLTSGLTFVEIAEIMDKSESTVKTKYFRSLKKLQGKMDALVLLITLLNL